MCIRDRNPRGGTSLHQRSNAHSLLAGAPSGFRLPIFGSATKRKSRSCYGDPCPTVALRLRMDHRYERRRCIHCKSDRLLWRTASARDQRFRYWCQRCFGLFAIHERGSLRSQVEFHRYGRNRVCPVVVEIAACRLRSFRCNTAGLRRTVCPTPVKFCRCRTGHRSRSTCRVGYRHRCLSGCERGTHEQK